VISHSREPDKIRLQSTEAGRYVKTNGSLHLEVLTHRRTMGMPIIKPRPHSASVEELPKRIFPFHARTWRP
jgi:hypothetical protein